MEEVDEVLRVFGFEDCDVGEFGVVVVWCGCKVDGLAYGEWRDVVHVTVIHYVDEDVFFGGYDGCE